MKRIGNQSLQLILDCVSRMRPSVKRLLITLDGPCASGKTTLAETLAGELHAPLIHTDDYVIPHREKTPERLAIPGGNCDAERLEREIIRPWKEGFPVRYRRYDCGADCLLPEESLPESDLLILEGCYCNLPPVRAYADLRFFLETSAEAREARLLKRESPESLQRFHERWIPLENAYFDAFGLPDAGCIRLRGDLPESCI